MDILMKIIGLLISLAFIYIGSRFTFFPSKSIQSLQRVKYKTTGEIGKRERIFSAIMGVIFILIGLYYLTIVVLSFIYPE